MLPLSCFTTGMAFRVTCGQSFQSQVFPGSVLVSQHPLSSGIMQITVYLIGSRHIIWLGAKSNQADHNGCTTGDEMQTEKLDFRTKTGQITLDTRFSLLRQLRGVFLLLVLRMNSLCFTVGLKRLSVRCSCILGGGLI